ncbi:MAG TPA: TfoX/Sxy family protein [Acidimicrobiales bacterium]|nr:TfoX/Sxy family protein [Acidimicrobiales bacterium]
MLQDDQARRNFSTESAGDLTSIMAFDEGLAERVRDLVDTQDGLSERKMFGGLCFLCDGNMSFGIVGSELMVRVGKVAYPEALALPHTREMDFTGRSMRGMVFVSEDGISEDDDLEDWLNRGMAFARSLPAK